MTDLGVSHETSRVRVCVVGTLAVALEGPVRFRQSRQNEASDATPTWFTSLDNIPEPPLAEVAKRNVSGLDERAPYPRVRRSDLGWKE